MGLETGGSLYWSTGLDTRGLEHGARMAKGMLSKLTSDISAMDIFAGVGLSAALAFGMATRASHEFVKELNKKMMEVSTISDSVASNFERATQAVVDMSTEIPEKAIGLADALYQIHSAGLDGADALETLKVSGELAIATLSETEVAADALTSIINGFGDAAGDTNVIASQLFTTIKNAKTTMNELGPAVARISGLWSSMGGTFTDLMAMFATGAKTLKTDILATGIRGMATAIVKPTDEAQKAARKLGIELSSAALRAKGFGAFMGEIIEKTGGSEAALAKLFPEVRALTAFLAIAKDEGGEFTKQLDEMRVSTNAHRVAFQTMVEEEGNQLTILGNLIAKKFQPLGKAMSNAITGATKSMIRDLRRTGNEFTDMAATFDDVLISMQKRRNQIAGYVKTLEELSGKAKLTAEEVGRLKSAERALAAFMPEVNRAMLTGAEHVDILATAKQGLIKVDKDLLEMQEKIAELNVKATELEIMQFEKSDSAAHKSAKKAEQRYKAREEMLRSYAAELARFSQTGKIQETGPMSVSATGAPGPQSSSMPAFESTMERMGIDLEDFRGKAVTVEQALDRLKKTDQEFIKVEIDHAISSGNLAIEQQRLTLELEKRKKILEEIGKTTKSVAGAGEGAAPDMTPTVGEPIADFDKWLDAYATYEERLANIRETYADLKRQARQKYDAEEEEAMIVRLEKAQDEEEEKVMSEKRVADAKKAFTADSAQYHDKMSDRELRNYLDYLADRMRAAGNNHEYMRLLETEMYRIKSEINKKLREEEEESEQEAIEALKDRKKDVRQMTVGELLDYRDFLDKKLKLFKNNAAMQKYVLEELQRVEEALHDKLLEVFDVAREMAKSIAPEMSELIDAIANFAKSLASKDYAAAAISYIQLAFAAIEALNKMQAKEAEAFNKKQEQLERTIDLLDRIKDLYSSGLQIDIMVKQIQLLSQTLNDTSGNLANIIRSMDPYQLTHAMDSMLKILEEARKQQFGSGAGIEEDINALIATLEIVREIQQLLTGTTADAIADGIIEGFREGKKGAEDFADTFEDLMIQAVLNAFKIQMMQKYIEPWYDLFADLATGGLTEDEMKLLKWTWDHIMEKSGQLWDSFQQFADQLGLDLLTRPEGLRGAIQGITEETAGILAGQFNAVRMNILQSLEEVRGIHEGVDLCSMLLEDIAGTNREIAINTRNLHYLRYGGRTAGTVSYMRAVGGR
jgi:TP901 family phage tail tape measure protein